MIYRIFAALVITGVIVGSLLLARQQSEAPASTTVQQTAFDEGYSANDARLIETGVNGLPLYTLNAATIRQLPNQDLVQLTQVQMSFRDADGTPWTATADRGELEQSAGQVELWGNVHVSGTPPSSQGPAEVTSAALSVNIHSDIVSTSDPVTLLWSGRRLNSRGMVANFKDHRVQLESDVHGTFSPQ